MLKYLGTIMSSSVFGTVLSGVAVFVLGQLIAKGSIEPYVSFREQLGKISALLLREQSKITNFHASADLINELKNAAAQLMAKYSALPWYVKKLHLKNLRFVPSQSDILSAAQNLNLIATAITGDGKHALNSYIKEIGHSLCIPTTYSS